MFISRADRIFATVAFLLCERNSNSFFLFAPEASSANTVEFFSTPTDAANVSKYGTSPPPARQRGFSENDFSAAAAIGSGLSQQRARISAEEIWALSSANRAASATERVPAPAAANVRTSSDVKYAGTQHAKNSIAAPKTTVATAAIFRKSRIPNSINAAIFSARRQGVKFLPQKTRPERRAESRCANAQQLRSNATVHTKTSARRLRCSAPPHSLAPQTPAPTTPPRRQCAMPFQAKPPSGLQARASGCSGMTR